MIPINLVADLDGIAAVHSDRLTVEVLAAHCKQNSSSHVLVFSRSLGRKTLLVLFGHLALLVVIPAFLGSHFRRKDTRGN